MPTIQCLADHYAAEHVAVKAVAQERVGYALKQITAYFGLCEPMGISIPACRQYAKDRGVSPGTVRYELGILKAVLSHAVKWGHITPAEVPYIELPAAPEPKQRWLTKQEFERLVSAAEPRIKNYILLMYYTAARKGSVEKLTRRCVDLENNRIDLNVERTRTKKRKPIVPIDEPLKPIMEYLCSEAAEDEPLLGGASLRYGFERAVAAAGLEDVTPHVIRHSRITHLLQAGVKIWVVASLAGDNVTTIERVYGHHCPEYLESALQNLM